MPRRSHLAVRVPDRTATRLRARSLVGFLPLGAIARPAHSHLVTVLPTTRSGKMLRRSIQALAEGRNPGDLTTRTAPAALDQIRDVVRRG